MCASIEEMLTKNCGMNFTKMDDCRWLIEHEDDFGLLVEECRDKLDFIYDAFNENNTHWETADGVSHLIYDGSLEYLADEYGISYDDIYSAFARYEDESRDLIDTMRDIELDKKGL